MRELLRAVRAEPRPPHIPPPGRRDLLLAGLLAPAAVLEGALRPDLPWRWLSVAVVVALVPTLLWRRQQPLAMVVVAFAGTALVPLITGGGMPELYSMAYLVVLPYALLRWGSGPQALAGAAVMVGKTGLASAVHWTGPGDLVARFAVLLAAGALGVAVRYRAGARLRELDRVRLLERERLARELHDTVAHHVSAMAIRAQAGLATSEFRPDAATDALRVIETEASRALTEMRSMVRVLRRNRPADLAPGPGLADLERLGEGTQPGPPVDVEIEGATEGLPPSVAAALYRLAQESVTNARRHARHATRIEVRVSVGADRVRLRVSDDGEAGHARPAGSPGYGLTGMAERADLLGGTLRAGPGPGRGWTVTAVLPCRPVAA
jgi:signal transduction histidine kinase